MTTTGMDLSPERIQSRRQKAVWLTRHGWTGREIARELRVSLRTIERYRARARAGERR